MTTNTEEALNQAAKLRSQIEALQDDLDKILTPLVKEAVDADSPNVTLALLSKMPAGFHRTELRTHHIERMSDYEYRRRYNSANSQ